MSKKKKKEKRKEEKVSEDVYVRDWKRYAVLHGTRDWKYEGLEIPHSTVRGIGNTVLHGTRDWKFCTPRYVW